MEMLKRILPYFRYLKPVRLQFSLGILFGVLYSVASGLGLPLMAENVFPILFGNTSESPQWLLNLADKYFDGKTDGGFLIICCMAMPLTILLRSLGSIGNGYYMAHAGIHVVQSIQTHMFEKVQSLQLAFFNKYKTGEINLAVMGYPNRIKAIVVDTSNDLIKQPLTLISATSFLLYKSYITKSFFIGLIGLLSIPVIVIIVRRILSYIAVRSKQLVKVEELLESWVLECFQSPIEVRAYNLKKRHLKKFKKKLKSIFKLRLKGTRYSLLISPSIEIVAAIGMAFALYLGTKNGMGEGEFLALIIALYVAYNPIKRIGAIQAMFKRLEAPLDRLEAVLNTKVDIMSPNEPKSLSNPVKGSITFEDVSFKYEANRDVVLENVSLEMEAGKTYGLMGRSGSGKSTLANLILRLYDPSKGRVLIDGLDIKEIDLETLRNQIAYVPQTPILFGATIRENIKIGKFKATRSEVELAAKYANAHEFISSLPNGYDTIVSERGNSLSGGQRQKISIARAFLKNAPILILDEATSSLDNESDADIKDAIEKLCKGRTTIVIAHRLSSLENIDDRILLQDGKLVGFGSHEFLKSNVEDYLNLIKSYNV